MSWKRIGLIGGVVVLMGAVAGVADTPVIETTAGPIRVETVASGLAHPWALAFLPGGGMLVTERPGRVRFVSDDGAVSPPLKGGPITREWGQGGLLDIVLDPDFADTSYVYFSYAEIDGRAAGTAVARARLVGEGPSMRFEDLETIFRMSDKTRGTRHFGSRLVFAPDGTLFVTIGERGEPDRAQDPGDHAGSVVRINPDGSVPPDNPFVDGGALPEIWSIGHRNAQGAAINPATGMLWTVAHGARGGDEINIPLAGRNYGWPVISYGRHYTGGRIGEGTAKEGMEQPVFYWDPSIAPSGMAFYSGDAYPGWSGDLFIGALKETHLARLDLDGDRVVGEERLLEDLGERIRDVRQGPDGLIYLLTDSGDGQVIRLTPVTGD